MPRRKMAFSKRSSSQVDDPNGRTSADIHCMVSRMTSSMQSDECCRADRLHVRIENHKKNERYTRSHRHQYQYDPSVYRAERTIVDSFPTNPVMTQFGILTPTIEREYCIHRREKKQKDKE